MPWLRAHHTTIPDKDWKSGIEDDRQLVWAMIVEIGLNERHFNQLQTSYRTLASTWLLGLFAAAGFLLSRKASDLPLNPSAVLAFLAPTLLELYRCGRLRTCLCRLAACLF